MSHPPTTAPECDSPLGHVVYASPSPVTNARLRLVKIELARARLQVQWLQYAEAECKNTHTLLVRVQSGGEQEIDGCARR